MELESLESKLNHQQAQTIHARRRALERFGFDFDKNTLSRFRELIARRDDLAVLLHIQRDEREIWAVWHGGEWVPMVFDTHTHRIATILPPSILRRNKGKLPW